MKTANRKRWVDIPLARKVLIAVGIITLLLFLIDSLLYFQVNRIIEKMDTVYSSNVNMTEISEALDEVQDDLYSYLSVKSSESLESLDGKIGNAAPLAVDSADRHDKQRQCK